MCKFIGQLHKVKMDTNKQLELYHCDSLVEYHTFAYLLRKAWFRLERWNIKSNHPITLFTHFKTNTKFIDMYRVLRCCVLMKKSKHSESHEMG